MNELLDEIKGYLSAALTTKFTTYYKGEVIIVPKSYLPALMVWGNSTKVVARTTSQDQYSYGITIKAVVDINKYVNEAGTGTSVKAQEDLYKLMEERDPTTNQPIATCVLGVLRKVENISGVKYLYNNDIDIQYSTIQTGEYFYCTATMTLNLVTDLINRPS